MGGEGKSVMYISSYKEVIPLVLIAYSIHAVPICDTSLVASPKDYGVFNNRASRQLTAKKKSNTINV